MGGIHDLLERWGFVRLRDFGLALTPDRRVIATRPILDDGHGGQIVGWEANDLAAAELAPWKPEGAAKPIKRPLIRPPVPRPIVAAPAVVAAPAAPIVPVVEDVVRRPNSEAESEWDWEIAMARARAVADEIEQSSPPIQQLTLLAPDLADEWNDIEWERQLASARRHPTERPTEKMIEPPKRPSVVTIQPIERASAKPISMAQLKTVIPVPSLPVANDLAAVRPLDTKPLPAAPRRFPRATDQRVAADETRRDIAPAPRPSVARVRR
jgi:hypothetical protein